MALAGLSAESGHEGHATLQNAERGSALKAATRTPAARAPAPTTAKNDPPEVLTLQEVIFEPAKYLDGPEVAVLGTCVLLDHELGRIDLSHRGAKLIVHIGKLGEEPLQRLRTKELGVHSELVVTGVVRKQARRTFLEARYLRPAA